MELYTIIFWILGFLVGLYVLYFIIKTAIVNGIRDSGLLERNEYPSTEQNSAYSKPNTAQNLLKSRYERGEINFEVYKEEWNRLKG